MVVGLDNRVEIWDKPTYEEFMKARMAASYKAGLELLKLF